jgi:hypothetical protein
MEHSAWWKMKSFWTLNLVVYVPSYDCILTVNYFHNMCDSSVEIVHTEMQIRLHRSVKSAKICRLRNVNRLQIGVDIGPNDILGCDILLCCWFLPTLASIFRAHGATTHGTTACIDGTSSAYTFSVGKLE